jgi:hypothetical protein
VQMTLTEADVSEWYSIGNNTAGIIDLGINISSRGTDDPYRPMDDYENVFEYYDKYGIHFFSVPCVGSGCSSCGGSSGGSGSGGAATSGDVADNGLIPLLPSPHQQLSDEHWKEMIDGVKNLNGEKDDNSKSSNGNDFLESLKSFAYNLTYEIPIWGWCQKASFSLNNGDYVGWAANWAMGFVDGISFGNAIYLQQITKVSIMEGQNILASDIISSKLFGIESKFFSKEMNKTYGGLGAESWGILNNNKYIRMGWSWVGKDKSGDIINSYVFRFGIGSGTPHTHFDIYYFQQTFIPWRQ